MEPARWNSGVAGSEWSTIIVEDDDPEAAFTISVSGQGTTDPAPGVHYFAKYDPVLASRDCRALWAQGYGSASCPPEAGCYNSAVTLTASAAADWAFYHWWGDVYVDDDQPVVALDTGMDRVIEAEFVWRPGVGALDLVSDLAVFFSEAVIFATVETFDRNEIDYDANLDPVFVGNGILDAAELALVEAVLKNAATDFSARGGITADGVWKAWQTNLAQAQEDMASRSASVQRVVAAYMTLGDYKSVESIKDLALAKFSVTLDDAPYDRSRQRFFYWKHDPDADGLDNLDEWTLAAPPGQAPTLGDLPTFLAQSLNGVANGQASAGGAPPDCSDKTCPAMALVNLIPPSGGTITVTPQGLVPMGTEIQASATPNPAYYFLGYTTSQSTLASGSLDPKATFSLTGPLTITPPWLYPAVNVSGTFYSSYLEVPRYQTNYSISVEGENTVEIVEENVIKYFAPPYTDLSVKLTNKSGVVKVAGSEIDACVGCAAPGYALQTDFPVQLPAFGGISVEPWFGNTLPDRVTFSLVSNQGGTVVGAQTAGGGVEFAKKLRVSKGAQTAFGATANPGFRFLRWVQMADSQTGGTVEAEFEEIPRHALTVETGGPDAPCSGYVSVEGQNIFGLRDGENNAKGVYYYQNGLPDKVALEAHASPGYGFVRWDGAETGGGIFANSTSVTMDEDKTVTAVFAGPATIDIRSADLCPENLIEVELGPQNSNIVGQYKLEIIHEDGTAYTMIEEFRTTGVYRDRYVFTETLPTGIFTRVRGSWTFGCAVVDVQDERAYRLQNLGRYRHTQYNRPNEADATCDGSDTSVCFYTNSCTMTEGTLKGTFQDRVRNPNYGTGIGLSINHGVVQQEAWCNDNHPDQQYTAPNCSSGRHFRENANGTTSCGVTIQVGFVARMSGHPDLDCGDTVYVPSVGCKVVQDEGSRVVATQLDHFTDDPRCSGVGSLAPEYQVTIRVLE